MKQGRTLVEVLVVCAIVAILSALIGVGVQGARKASLSSKCLSNLKTIGQALHLYAGDHNEYLPPFLTHGAGILGDPVQSIPGRPREWRDSLLAYVKDRDSFYCPLDRIRGRRPGAGPSWDTTFTSYDTTGYSFGQERFGPNHSYSINLAIAMRNYSSTAYLSDKFYKAPFVTGTRNPYSTFHGKSSNNLFLDGHVKNVPQAD